jgi:hypothetical protein
VQQSGLDAAAVVGFLHENYTQFVGGEEALEDAAAAAHCLSTAGEGCLVGVQGGGRGGGAGGGGGGGLCMCSCGRRWRCSKGLGWDR